EPAVTGDSGPAAWLAGFAAGAAVGQAAGNAELPGGHPSPVVAVGPLASRILAAALVVAEERAATTTPVTITPSTAHPRPGLRTAWWRPDLRAGIVPLTRRPGAPPVAHGRPVSWPGPTCPAPGKPRSQHTSVGHHAMITGALLAERRMYTQAEARRSHVLQEMAVVGRDISPAFKAAARPACLLPRRASPAFGLADRAQP